MAEKAYFNVYISDSNFKIKSDILMKNRGGEDVVFNFKIYCDIWMKCGREDCSKDL